MLVGANWERERIGEQWLSARTRAVSRGIHVSRHVPPGYRRLPKSTDAATDRRLVPDETHGPVVAEAFAMAAHDDSYSTIADYLTAPPAARPETLANDDVAELVAELQRRGDLTSLRELFGSAIQAVFVRPAASRARNLPIEDRVRIVWRDEEPLELPRRGERFEPRAYAW